MFTASGIDKQTGRTFIVTWDNGVLSGDDLVQEAIGHATPFAIVGVPGGPYWEGAEILKSDNGTWLLLYSMYKDVELISGKLSPLPSVPKGAIP